MKARRIKPKGITPLKPQVLETIYVTCRLVARNRARHARGERGAGSSTAGDEGKSADPFDLIEDRHLSNDWFPPSGFMTPTRKDRNVTGTWYKIEEKPSEAAIRFDGDVGRPLAMREFHLSPSAQILLDWMDEVGVLADFDNYIRGRDKTTSADIQEWWNDEDEMTPGPTKDETEILHGDAPRG